MNKDLSEFYVLIFNFGIFNTNENFVPEITAADPFKATILFYEW